MKILVIYSHSYQSQSVSNRTIIDVLSRQEGYSVRNLEELYPSGKIDVQAEQAALLEADVIVLQHPLFWYNVPSLMKHWMDEVFTFGFAYGDGGDKLQGKRLVHSFTAAASPQDFSEAMLGASTGAIEAACGFCGLTYSGYVHTLGLLPLTNPNCEAEAKAHAHRLMEYIRGLKG